MFREFMADDLNIFVYYHQSELVILRKQLIDHEECLMRSTTEQERSNECFKGKIDTQESVGLCQRILWVMPPWWINLEC